MSFTVRLATNRLKSGPIGKKAKEYFCQKKLVVEKSFHMLKEFDQKIRC